MPYEIRKSGDGYKVFKKGTSKSFSKDPLSKEKAKAQLAALHINKANEAVGDEAIEQKLQDYFKQSYTKFVTSLGSSAQDSKFRQFIKNNDLKKFNVKLTSVPVTKLTPTQNEIDIKKSLDFPLKDAKSAEKCLRGGTVKVQSPIIVFVGQGGKYIVDGHHRWSQVYCLNKDASVLAYEFTDTENQIKKPLDALKVTQLAILGAGATKIPSQTVQGTNLLTISRKALIEYIVKEIDQQVVAVFNSILKIKTKGDIARYIAGNVDRMRKTSQPVPGAPSRGFMPQADDVPGGQKATVAKMQQGLPIPVAERLKTYIKSIILQEIKKYK